MFNSSHKNKNKHIQTAADATGDKGTFLVDNRTQQPVAQRKPNNTGLPENLKSGIENLSGHSMDDVKVHYNSSQPAQLNAHAYAQGNQIHLAPGQEKHLPHEAWHVVQQKQGRVRATTQLKGKVNINDDSSLEKEADVMGAKATQFKGWRKTEPLNGHTHSGTVQRKIIELTGDNMDQNMTDRYKKAFNQFSGTILSKSSLSTDADVVIYGVSEETTNMGGLKGAFATTSLYIGTNGYKGEEIDKFQEVWFHDAKNINKDTSVRLVITLNMTMNATMPELYATLLHEWNVHAKQWAGLIDSIRKGKGSEAVAKTIKEETFEKRAQAEHKVYANYNEKQLQEMAEELGLGEEEKNNVVHHLEQDTLNYSDKTGKALTNKRKKTSNVSGSNKKLKEKKNDN